MSQRKRLAPAESQPSPKHRANGYADSSLHRAEDGYTAPTSDDRLDAAVIEAAKARGFSIAVRCTRCGQWVVAADSVAAHMGPVCRSKAVDG